MKGSQYTESYLNNEGRYTIATFLKYNLRGKAREYGGGYFRALQKHLERLLDEGSVEKCSSVHGGIAYRRKA